MRRCSGDFPGGPVVKNPPSNARDAGSIPGWETKIPHAVGQVRPRAATTELACLNERARMPQTTEPTCHDYREDRVLQLERNLSAAMKRPRAITKRSCMPQQRSRVPQLRPNAAKKKKENK